MLIRGVGFGTDTWTLHTRQDGLAKSYRGRFLFFGTGYYDYDEPYTPEFPGIDRFGRRGGAPAVLARALDLPARRVVVIGSGATAVSMIPSLAGRRRSVTMLQRSPTYMMSAARGPNRSSASVK